MDMTEFAEVNPHVFTTQRSEADKNLLVKFYMKPRQDKAASLEKGRPIFKDVEYIDIKIPGNRNAGAGRPATDDDKKRFPDHYRAFKDRVTDAGMEGTPLSEWPLVSRSMAEELSFFHVKTVEQLVTMSDAQAAKFMGLGGIRQKAKIWLEASKREKPLWDMDEKIKAQAAQIEELQKALSEVLTRVEEGRAIDGENEAQQARNRKRAITNAKSKVQ